LGVRVPPGLRTFKEESTMNKISQYVNDVQQEIAKVSWPRREELVSTTGVVLFVCVLFSIFVFGIDVLLSRLLKLIFRA
jgi:preprotein translocase subunit SecE